MTKEFMKNNDAESSSTPSAMVPTTLATSSDPSNHTPLTTDTNRISFINNSVPTNIGFVDKPVLPLTNSEGKFNFVESFRQTEVINNNNQQSAPPTQIESCDNYETTSFEMKSLKLLLREAKNAVNHSKSKDVEKQRLTVSLEEIWSFIKRNRWKISEVEANLANEELKLIMTNRRKMTTGCLFSFLILIMLFRFALDIFSIITVSRSNILKPVTICLIVVDMIGCVLTGFIIVFYCNRTRITKFETVFCIIWAMFYGIVTTLVVRQFSATSPEIMICGYTSMVTCILQGCLKLCDKNSKPINRRHSCKVELPDKTNDVIIQQPMNKVTTENDSFQNVNKPNTRDENIPSKQNDSNKQNLSDSVIVQFSNNHLNHRINAIKNLENTIKIFLIEIHGSDYINEARFDSPEEINYRSRNVVNAAEIPGTTYPTHSTMYPDSWIYCCTFYNCQPDCLPVLCFGYNGCCSCNCDGGGGSADCCCNDCGNCCAGDCGNCCTGDCGNCCAGDCGNCCTGDCGNFCTGDCGNCCTGDCLSGCDLGACGECSSLCAI